MTTYVILRNRIADDVRSVSTAAASDISTQIASEVLSAIAFYERAPFYFNETSGITFNTVVDQENYSSSDLAAIATLVKITALKVTLSGVKYPVTPVDFDTIEDSQDGTVKGLPRNFAYYNQRIRLYPIPDAVRVMTMAHVRRLTALSADGDSNAWTTDAEELIRARASRKLFETTVRNVERATIAGAQEQEALRVLKRETRLRRSNNIQRVDAALVSRGGYDIRTE
jgi:hypothetical protein